MYSRESSSQREVLALKYRPKRFEDLIGQETISTTLSLALDTNRLSHAYLLSGLRGSGKTSTARIMAKALVCDNAPTSKPCEVCDGCISANENRHLDIIEMDAASNRGIDDIKDLIEHTKYKPTSAKYKVFIIDEVHMLTTQAFNALLKTLEEPPKFVKFILATTDPLKLPATILSRTQHFRFKKISDKNVIHHLSHILNIEDVEFETGALEVLTRSGSGSLRDTLTLLDQAIIYSKGIITTTSVTEMLGMINPSFMEDLFSVILDKGDIRVIVESLESYEIEQVLNEMSIYLKQKMLLNDKRFDVYLFDKFFRIIADSKQLLSLNSESGFVLILTLLKMVDIVKIDINVKSENNIKTVKSQSIPPIALEKPTQIVEVVNDSLEMFKKLTANIYEKSYDIGKCFESSFQFDSYNNNILHLNSIASGECKTLLYKNFTHIRNFIEEVFGENTDIEFKKIKQEVKKEMARIVQPSVPVQNNIIEEDQNNIGSMIEDIELNQSSSCIQSVCDVQKPTLSQTELNINDILNSKMTTTIMQLFQSKNPPVIKSKL